MFSKISNLSTAASFHSRSTINMDSIESQRPRNHQKIQVNNSWNHGSEFESIVCNSSLPASISVRFFHVRTLESSCPLLFTGGSSRNGRRWSHSGGRKGYSLGLGNRLLVGLGFSLKGRCKLNLRFRTSEWDGIPGVPWPFISLKGQKEHRETLERGRDVPPAVCSRTGTGTQVS